MKKHFSLLITTCFFVSSLNSQPPDDSFELTQLGGYVMVDIKGQNGVYASYLYRGNIDDVEVDAFIQEESSMPENNRDRFEEQIDLGFLPSDICYYNIIDNDNEKEFILVYGGNKFQVRDGGNHAHIKTKTLNNTIRSIHNMAFMPIYPQLYQIAYTTNPLSHFFCASEGGEIYIFNTSLPFDLFQEPIIDSHQASIISSSIQASKDDNYQEHIVWAINYWDGTCKLKDIAWNSSSEIYEVIKERVWYNDEIIDFKIVGSSIAIAFLNSVLQIDIIDFSDILMLPEISIDKLDVHEEYPSYIGHAKSEKKLFIISQGGYTTFEHEFIHNLAFRSCWDSDNDRIYFTGYNNDYGPGVSIYKYDIDEVSHFFLQGAIDVKYNTFYEPNPGEVNFRVCAVGNDRFVGFDDVGDFVCDDNLYCHHGYRIAIDTRMYANPESNGTMIACLKDGLIHQFRRFTCEKPTITPDFFTTGISSSMICYNETEKSVYAFDNGNGYSSTYIHYDEIEQETFMIPISISTKITDCMYNKESNLIIAAKTDCYTGNGVFGIIENNFIDIEPSIQYQMCNLLTNYDEYIYCQQVDYTSDVYLFRYLENNGSIDKEKISMNHLINSIAINKDDNLLYATCKDQNLIATINHISFIPPTYATIINNDPVDICYAEELEKIYIAQRENQLIEVYNKEFNLLESIAIEEEPKKIEYNPYQREIYVFTDYEGFGLNKIFIIDCTNDHEIGQKIIRKSDGIVFDTINDQFYLQTNNPNSGGDLSFNIKALDNFDHTFSNSVNTGLSASSDILLSSKKEVPAKLAMNYEENYFYAGYYGASTIVKIKAYDETLTFRPGGWEWISFPRLERYKDEPFPTIPLLKRLNNWDPEPDYLEMIYEPDGTLPEYIFFDLNNGWDPESTLDEVKSTQGYKLQYLGNTPEVTIRLEGAKEDYDMEIPGLVVGENWLGYFLDENYLPQQCLPGDIWDKLVQIQTQHWSMTKTNNDPPWVYIGEPKPFTYGDLVVLVLDQEYQDFQWQMPGDGEEAADFQETAFYNYEEQPDYLPFYIETDSTSDIQEIAVLADGEVRGAAVCEPGDTLVEVQGYLEGVPSGTVIEFETWNGYKSEPADRNSYVVIDHQRKVREKRTIYTGEKAIYHHVSLKSNEVFDLPPEIGMVTCKPNPFRQSVDFSFRLNRESNVRIDVMDINGSVIKTVINGSYPEGLYNFTWQGDNEAGNRIKPGVYFYRVCIGSVVVQTDKIVMIK